MGNQQSKDAISMTRKRNSARTKAPAFSDRQRSRTNGSRDSFLAHVRHESREQCATFSLPAALQDLESLIKKGGEDRGKAYKLQEALTWRSDNRDVFFPFILIISAWKLLSERK